ncbi:MAG TPA: YicC/YloC family endoribonuclease [Gammaproteobacteria bacterium]|nr:YicC/YloC family endoribonuclease [Gammaproteobacteria bacterium]
MIHSMTAFAREQAVGAFGQLTCEIRSINHRYLEVSVHLPESLRGAEMMVREVLRKHVKRGKIECYFRFQAALGVNTAVNVNLILAQELCRAAEGISTLLKAPAPVQPCDILKFPGVLEGVNADQPALTDEVLRLAEKTVKDLLAARGREGSELKQLFEGRLVRISEEMKKVRTRLPDIMKETHDKLLKRFTDAKVDLDPGRLEQEMVMFAQKIDVAEEIERTETHAIEVRRVLNEGGLVGRRLDFLMQELNREANTLGSKSVDPVITHAAVELKVIIEQMREQIQNLE